MTSVTGSVLRACWRNGRWGRVRWGRFAGGMAGAMILAAGAVWGVTVAGRAAGRGGLAAWDERWLLKINDKLPFGFTDGIIFESPANLLILIPVTLLAAGVAAWRGRAAWAVGFVAAYVLARPLIWLGWSVWDRQRPDLIADGAAALAAYSFPSGHALLGSSLYGLIALAWITASRSAVERVAAVLVWAWLVVTICAGRLLLGAHWPSDVVAGTLLGSLWAGLIYAVVRWSEPPAGSSQGGAGPSSASSSGSA